jgi:hypothetical protein
MLLEKKIDEIVYFNRIIFQKTRYSINTTSLKCDNLKAWC